MQIINPFQGRVINILQNTTNTMFNLPSVGNGYKVSVNITAHTKEHNSTIHKTFFVQPKSNFLNNIIFRDTVIFTIYMWYFTALQ